MARRADRLFEIIQILRTASGPVTADSLARRIEVTPRTIYRDIATLQARRVPIEGAAGIGYVLRRGFDLPPLMFTLEEIDAIALGTRLVKRVRDRKLRRAADSVLSKVTSILPDDLRADPAASALYVSEGDTPANAVDLSEVRTAIRRARKMRITYVDDRQRRTRRTVWPVALAYYVDATLIGAWCELRRDWRSFRVDRIAAARTLDQSFDNKGNRLTAQWLALPKERTEGPT